MKLKLSNQTKKQIGLDYLLSHLKIYTPYGRLLRDEQKMFSPFQKEILIQEYENIANFVRKLQNNSEILPPIIRELKKIKNLYPIIEKLRLKQILSTIELFQLKTHALICIELSAILNANQLTIINETIPNLTAVLDLLDPKHQRLPIFAIYSQFSLKLKEIRKRKHDVENLIVNALDEESKEKLIQDRMEIILEEKAEEYLIRENLSEMLRSELPHIQTSVAIIGHLDWIIAKARLALVNPSVKPKIHDLIQVSAQQMYNPYISDLLNQKGCKFTPIDIDCESGVTVITGANMGGKTVCLKTFLLNTVLAQMGFFVFAENFEMCLFDFFALVSDDLQNIQSGLSSFGAEVIQINLIIEKLKKHSGFILFDEIARGTNPGEGAVIVKGLIEYLHQFKSIIGITTHYDKVVPANVLHYQIRGLKGCSIEDLNQQMDKILTEFSNSTKSREKIAKTVAFLQQRMDYHLELVASDTTIPKDALNIVQLLNMDPELIHKFLDLSFKSL